MRTRRTTGGFSLIELVIVTVVLGILAAATAPILASSLNAYTQTSDDIVVLDKLRYAIERLAREIRSVQYASSTDDDDTSNDDCREATPTTDRYCLFSMGATGMSFLGTYIDGSGSPVFRNVAIAVTGTSPNQTVTLAYGDMAGTSAQPLTDEVKSLTLSYYQKDGVTPATLANDVNCASTDEPLPACPAYVEINLTLSHNGNDYSQRTRVGLRRIPG